MGAQCSGRLDILWRDTCNVQKPAGGATSCVYTTDLRQHYIRKLCVCHQLTSQQHTHTDTELPPPTPLFGNNPAVSGSRAGVSRRQLPRCLLLAGCAAGRSPTITDNCVNLSGEGKHERPERPQCSQGENSRRPGRPPGCVCLRERGEGGQKE